MSPNQDTKLTVLIPTFNRPAWLKVSLSFFASYGSNIKVIVVDGSTERNKILNRKNISTLGSNFEIHDYPSELHMAKRLSEGLKKVQTPYTLIWPDDDFLIPTNLHQITELLDDHPDFSAAIGKVICLLQVQKLSKVFPSSSYFLIDHLQFATSIKDDAILRRILSYFLLTRLGSIPLFYSVRRTSQLKKTFDLIKDQHALTTMELISNLDCLIEGKIGFLDVPFGFRNYVSKPTNCINREGSESYFPGTDIQEVHDTFSKILRIKHGWSEEVSRFSLKQVLSVPFNFNEYTYGEGIPISQAYPHLKMQSLAMFIMNILHYPWQKKHFGIEQNDFKKLTAFLSHGQKA
jgi:glycosyltransferase domain-containing protein